MKETDKEYQEYVQRLMSNWNNYDGQHLCYAPGHLEAKEEIVKKYGYGMYTSVRAAAYSRYHEDKAKHTE